MQYDVNADKNRIFKVIRNSVIIAFWLVLIVFCFINRDKLTVENIINYTPSDTIAAVFIILLLFAVKSLTFFVYGGLLYSASGIMFPLPLAVFVNFLGTVIMTSIPFFIGKRMGNKTIDQLTNKYPKLSILYDLQNKNELFVCFFVRIVGCLPSDALGIYLGAMGIHYKSYICGTLLGMAASIISFSVMGMSVNDITSPAFIISLSVDIVIMTTSLIIYIIRRIKSKNKTCGGK